jgi:hypothetical protein
MAVEPAVATCPTELWRVGRSSEPLRFSRIEAEDAATSSGGNRFDVPGGEVLYTATDASGAFAETISRFRPTASMRALPPEEDEHLMAVGSIPADWRNRRQLVRLGLVEPLPFLDVDKPETHTYLTQEMAPLLEALGIDNLDIATVRGPNRFLTRSIAQWAYAAKNDDDEFLYSGLRYESRLGPHECWAVFTGTRITAFEAMAISKTHPDLVAVARSYGLVVH